jgi:hypothetical protein
MAAVGLDGVGARLGHGQPQVVDGVAAPPEAAHGDRRHDVAGDGTAVVLRARLDPRA